MSAENRSVQNRENLEPCDSMVGRSTGEAMIFDEIEVRHIVAAVTEAAAKPVRETPYSIVMALWTRWVSLKDFQYSDGDANLQDSKDFMRTGEAVECMINGLPRAQWWAIRKARGISTVWIFPNLSLAETLEDAERALTPKMKSHVDTRRYFN